ncbi:holin [Polaromonas sp. YR568]|uniref:holin n=1 Tax=Polaromonas sp. YR568 TaxID=1855301 RepID=UPI00313826D9
MDESQQAAIAAVASKVTYTGASTATVSWMISSEWGVVCGILVGVIGLLVNWYYKAKQDRREQAAHDRRMTGK